MATLLPWRQSENWLEQFRNEINDTFQRFFQPTTQTQTGVTQSSWRPRIDVEDKDKEVLVKADIPGVDPKDVEITVSDNSLVLSGDRKEEQQKEEKNYRRIERFVGRFYREIPLPVGADTNKISANSSNGVITITIPKSEAAQPRKITVKSSS